MQYETTFNQTLQSSKRTWYGASCVNCTKQNQVSRVLTRLMEPPAVGPLTVPS
jgi:hypothetical protein